MIRIAFYTVVVLLLLSFFGVSLQHLVDSPTTQANFTYLWDLIVSASTSVIDFVIGEVNGLWNSIF